VAGTSITSALGKYEEWHGAKNLLRAAWRYAPHTLIPTTKSMEVYPLRDHARATELKASIPDYDRLFTFAFVRNPWDWQVSLYHFMKSRPLRPNHSMVKAMSFEDYLHWRLEHDLHLQKSFIFDGHGNCLVDFIGKYENLNADFSHICKKVGINETLPELKVSKKRKAYQSYYTEETKALISEAFAPDINAFGYEF
jgi:hypothetical protein